MYNDIGAARVFVDSTSQWYTVFERKDHAKENLENQIEFEMKVQNLESSYTYRSVNVSTRATATSTNRQVGGKRGCCHEEDNQRIFEDEPDPSYLYNSQFSRGRRLSFRMQSCLGLRGAAKPFTASWRVLGQAFYPYMLLQVLQDSWITFCMNFVQSYMLPYMPLYSFVCCFPACVLHKTNCLQLQ